MSDETIEHPATTENTSMARELQAGPGTDGGNTDTKSSEVSGGQPPVGDDRPRNTEF